MLDCVELLVDLPENGLKKGMVGAVVALYGVDNSEIEYEIEFVNVQGKPTALLPIKADLLTLYVGSAFTVETNDEIEEIAQALEDLLVENL